jgi:hypothetical protein
MVHWYKYCVFGHYASSCLYLKTRSPYFSKHNVSETGLCLCLQVKPTQLSPVDRVSPHLRTKITKITQDLRSGDRDSSIYWAQLSMFYLKTETESSLRNVF